MKKLYFLGVSLVLCTFIVTGVSATGLDGIDTKVFTYDDASGNYVKTFDDGTNDGCEIFVAGDGTVFDNGRCD